MGDAGGRGLAGMGLKVIEHGVSSSQMKVMKVVFACARRPI
jgi:hypothetical protein